MAKGIKTGGKNFEPGNPGGPGAPKIPEEIKQARKLNRLEFERVLNKYIHMQLGALRKIIEDPTTPVLDGVVCKILVKGFNEGDPRRLEFVIDRLIGKVKEYEPEKQDAESTKSELIGQFVSMLIDKDKK